MADSSGDKPKARGFASLFRPPIDVGTTILSGADPDDGNIVAFAARQRRQPEPAEPTPAWAIQLRVEMLALHRATAERGEGKARAPRAPSAAVRALREGYVELVQAGVIRPGMSLVRQHHLVVDCSEPVKRFGKGSGGLSYDTFVRWVIKATWDEKPAL